MRRLLARRDPRRSIQPAAHRATWSAPRRRCSSSSSTGSCSSPPGSRPIASSTRTPAPRSGSRWSSWRSRTTRASPRRASSSTATGPRTRRTRSRRCARRARRRAVPGPRRRPGGGAARLARAGEGARAGHRRGGGAGQLEPQRGRDQARGCAAPTRVRYLDMPVIQVSSTAVRRRAREGRPIRYLVPEEVVSLIGSRGLYRARPSRPRGDGERMSAERARLRRAGRAHRRPSRPTARRSTSA